MGGRGWGRRRTSGWVRMNSPREASSVYPFTPFPVVRTKFAEDPYLLWIWIQFLVNVDGMR